MVKQEVIEQSMSPWNSNPVLVRKSDGSLRFCKLAKWFSKVLENIIISSR
jgi:hypothetical protein